MKCNGIILKESKTKDEDKIIRVFTKEYGKLSFYVKDKKHNAATNIFSVVEIMFTEGENLHKVKSTYQIESFYNLRSDIERFTYASYFLEFIDELTEENNKDETLFNFLCYSFKKLEAYNDLELFKIIFEMRVLKEVGIYPNFFSCTQCEKDALNFDVFKGGVLCNNCKTESSFEILKSTQAAYIYILEAKIKDVYSFKVSDGVRMEMRKINDRFIKNNIEKEFKSLKFLGVL
jgi:DNA repair protein RecO (recombination protein O)